MNEIAVTSTRGQAKQGDRILVALDASPQSLLALKAAVELAALLDVELEALFVEDINLLRLCSLPFGQEVGSYTARLRPLDNTQIERQLRSVAASIERSVSRATLQTPVRWQFHVRRGGVVDELLAAAEQATLLSLGRAGRARRKRLGSTAQSLVRLSPRPLLILGEEGGLRYPLTVVYTGTPAARRAVALAARLGERGRRPVQVLLWQTATTGTDASDTDATEPDATDPEEEARGLMGEAAGEFRAVTRRELYETLNTRDGGTVVLPIEQAALVSEFDGPAILVP